MKRMIAAVLGAVLVSAASIYAMPQAKPAGSTFVGCLAPGSNGSYTLTNATEKGAKSKDKVNMKVVPESDKVKLDPHVTQTVEITGSVSGTGAAAVLTATKVSRKSDYCG